MARKFSSTVSARASREYSRVVVEILMHGYETTCRALWGKDQPFHRVMVPRHEKKFAFFVLVAVFSRLE
jgi:hypothetical protein